MATAAELIAIAESYIGITESPANSNNVEFNTRYYGKAVSGSSYPWCCTFIWCLFQDADAADLFYGGAKSAYVPSVYSYAKTHGLFVTEDYQPGDLPLYDWGGDGTPDHIGIIKTVSGTTITAIEGNTSYGNDSNGGEVMLRTRSTSTMLGAYRPAYDEEEEDDLATALSSIATAAGLSEDDTVTALGIMAKYANTTTETWETTAVETLKENGIIMSDHDPRAPVSYAEMAAMLNRIVAKIS